MKHTIEFVGLKKQHSSLRDKLLRACNRTFNKSMFILGKSVEEFENKFKEYTKSKYCVTVNSGTDALFLSMKSLNIGKGDEVITVPNSFLATASSIVATGAKPVFVDVSEDMNINPKLIEEKITKKTKAILPVHLTGRPCKIDRISKIAKDNNLYLIEDCAQSIGTRYKNIHVGTFGDTGCFSFHPLKTLNACGDGGCIITDNKETYDKLLQLRNIGLKDREHADIWGYNSRLDSLQAEILYIKFDYINYWIEKRRNNARTYTENLPENINTPKENKNEYCTYHTYIIKTKNRNDLKEYLYKNRIRTAIHYPIPIHLQKCAKSLGYKKGDFPETEKQSKTILSLPIYPELTSKELFNIIKEIRKWKSV